MTKPRPEHWLLLSPGDSTRSPHPASRIWIWLMRDKADELMQNSLGGPCFLNLSLFINGPYVSIVHWREEKHVVMEVVLSLGTFGKQDVVDGDGYCLFQLVPASCHPSANDCPPPYHLQRRGPAAVLANHSSPAPPLQSDGLEEDMNFWCVNDRSPWRL